MGDGRLEETETTRKKKGGKSTCHQLPVREWMVFTLLFALCRGFPRPCG